VNDLYRPPEEKKDFRAHRGPGGTCLRKQRPAPVPGYTGSTKEVLQKLIQTVEKDIAEEDGAANHYFVMAGVVQKLADETSGLSSLKRDLEDDASLLRKMTQDENTHRAFLEEIVKHLKSVLRGMP